MSTKNKCKQVYTYICEKYPELCGWYAKTGAGVYVFGGPPSLSMFRCKPFPLVLVHVYIYVISLTSNKASKFKDLQAFGNKWNSTEQATAQAWQGLYYLLHLFYINIHSISFFQCNSCLHLPFPHVLQKIICFYKKKQGTSGTSSQAIDFNKDSCSFSCSILQSVGNS